jgi:plastocyanin
MQYRT